MKNKKILFFINNLGIGGAERVFVDDVNMLHNQGFEVHIALLYGDEIKNPLLKELLLAPDKMHFLYARSILDFFAYRALHKLLNKYKFDVLYTTLHDAIFVSRLVALFIPMLRLVTREANTTKSKSILHKCADVIMNWRVDIIIAVSKDVKVSMLDYQSWYDNKVVVLHNGVSIPKLVGRGDPERILAVGSLTAKKNYQILIDAFELVSYSYPKAILYIVGDGVQRSYLEDLVKQKLLHSRVVFLGQRNHQEVQNEYCKAGVFVLSSDQEGCPNVLLEAMSFGVPSVATSVGAVPEIIDDGISGFVVPRRDSKILAQRIMELIKSKDLRERVGLSGQEKIKREFSNSVHIRRLIEVLSS